MNKIELYSMLVMAFVLSPIALTSRGGPTITAKKALKVACDIRPSTRFMLRHIWAIQIPISLLTALIVIYVLESWRYNPTLLTAALIVIASGLVIAAGALSSLPAYIIVNHWKHRQADRR
jgi:hypothetical protein